MRTPALIFLVLTIGLQNLAAAPLPLKVECTGDDYSAYVRLSVYHNYPEQEEVYISVYEVAPLYSRTLMIEQNDLIVVSKVPLHLKSRTVSPEFYVDMSRLRTEFHGYYMFNDSEIEQSIPLTCTSR